MHELRAIITERNFLVCLAAWTAAQTFKIVHRYIRARRDPRARMSRRALFAGNGGMPSAHVTLVACFTTLMGYQQGWSSPVFQCALVVLLITMNDAWGVRRAAGQHAVLLNRLAKARLSESLGHTPAEVAVGIALGVAAALALGPDLP